jgi:imidazolonepropionase-like amidohydrolase
VTGVRRAIGSLLLASLLTLVSCGGEKEPGIEVTASLLFDGKRFISPGAVLIRGREIVRVGTEPIGARRTIDLGDATILPGFIDLHSYTAAADLLEAGVTTVRILGAPLDAFSTQQAALMRVGTSGPILTAPGGYPISIGLPEIALPVRGEKRARAAVRRLARRDVDLVKLALDPTNGWPMLSAAEVRAIVAEAHRRGLRVTAHAFGPAAVERALFAGVDELSNVPCGGIPDGLLRGLVARDVEVIGALDALTSFHASCADPVADARRFAALGGELLYGTFLGAPGIAVGINVEELRLLRAAGLTTAAVLAAATARAGEQLGLEPLGALVRGAPADVIAVPGDARQLREDLHVPLLVVRGGRVVVDPEE